MSTPLNDALTIAARWIATARRELRDLGQDFVDLGASVRRDWRENPHFRATVVRSILKALFAAASKGPRAAILMLLAAVGELIVALATMLDGHRSSPAF